MDKEKEISEGSPKGFALIERFIEKEESSLFVERVTLTPGEAVIFTHGEGFKRFSQNQLNEELQKKDNLENFEVLALCDIKTGGLLFTQGKDRSYCLNSHIPQEHRILGLKCGTTKYVTIWDETKEAAEKRLTEYISQKSTSVKTPTK